MQRRNFLAAAATVGGAGIAGAQVLKVLGRKVIIN